MNTKIEFPRGMTAEIEVLVDDNPLDPTQEEDMAMFSVFETPGSFWKFSESNGWNPGHISDAVDGAVIKGLDGKLYMGLERYRHGVDVYALCRSGKFPDRQWDVSTIVGFISPHPDTDSDLIDIYNADPSEANKAALITRLEQDIKSYNHYLAGEVYGYVIKFLDSDGNHIGAEESCWGFIGDAEACLDEARDMACHMSLSVLTEEEIRICLESVSEGGLVGYVKNWCGQVLKKEETEGKTPFEIAHRLYRYITNIYLKGDVDPQVLIARYKGTPKDEYPWLTRNAWKHLAAQGHTDLGYWDWVVWELQLNSMKSREPVESKPYFTIQDDAWSGDGWQAGLAIPDKVKANIVRLACIKAYNMTYQDFLLFLDKESDGYTEEKFELMKNDFSKYFCQLDNYHSTKFMGDL